MTSSSWMFSLNLSLAGLCQIRNAWVAFTINKTETTQVTGSALISVTWESSGGDFALLSCIFRGDFFPGTFNYDYWGSIPASRQNVLFNLSLLYCRPSQWSKPTERHCGKSNWPLCAHFLYLTMNNGHLRMNGTGTERKFWMWRVEKRRRREREKNNHYPKTCSIMSEMIIPQPNL